MGKAGRWLRSMLGGGRKEQGRGKAGDAADGKQGDRKRWSFCKSSREPGGAAEVEVTAEIASAAEVGGSAAIARAAEAAWLKSLHRETERERSRHAIAAAADAAVAAAQAAVEVVRLTSQGTASTYAGAFAASRGRAAAAAAVKIQTAFRGFLAKKALRALRALVKLQALVRGYLVRKQAAATLQSMQALVRAQVAIRAARSHAAAAPHLRVHHHPPVRPRYSLQERHVVDDTRSEHGVAAYSRRLSASIESPGSYGYDRSPKIVEMDTGRPQSRSPSLRTSPPVTESGASEECYSYSYSYSAPSPLPPCTHLPAGAPPRIAVPNARHFAEYDWCALENARPATAQSTPRYAASHTPVTPAKSACGGFNSPSLPLNSPGYMSSTQSSDAKTRSRSAPKQRPEQGGAARKRVPLSEVILQARASLRAAGMQIAPSCHRSSSEAFSFKNAVASRLGSSSSEAADSDRDMFLHKGW